MRFNLIAWSAMKLNRTPYIIISSENQFLSFGLINPQKEYYTPLSNILQICVQNIADKCPIYYNSLSKIYCTYTCSLYMFMYVQYMTYLSNILHICLRCITYQCPIYYIYMSNKLHIYVRCMIHFCPIYMYNNSVSYLGPSLTPLVLHGISKCRVYSIVKLV